MRKDPTARCGTIAVGIGTLALVLLAGTAAWAQQSGCLERTIPLTVYRRDGVPAIVYPTISLDGSYRGKAVRVPESRAEPRGEESALIERAERLPRCRRLSRRPYSRSDIPAAASS